MWLQAPNISSVHGFSTRHGGVSEAPFQSLNLGGSDDRPSNIETNRKIALSKLGLDYKHLSTLKQIHSTEVCVASLIKQEGDALVSKTPGFILAVGIADCYPILLEDPENKVIAAVHAGWRGTVGRILKNTIQKMSGMGAKPQNIRAAIGQGISAQHFEVGQEVVRQFTDAGFSDHLVGTNKIDLLACNKQVLMENSIDENNIWAMNRCTYEEDFFSHRRDKGKTGRMWGLISLNDNGY